MALLSNTQKYLSPYAARISFDIINHQAIHYHNLSGKKAKEEKHSEKNSSAEDVSTRRTVFPLLPRPPLLLDVLMLSFLIYQ